MSIWGSDNGELPPKVEGLPVSGYRAQGKDAIDAVNHSKRIEERVLRMIDQFARDEVLACDPRWLAVGRTAIEQGFMAINRSVFKPERVDL